MSNDTGRDRFDIIPMMARTLYFGMFTNVILPVAVLMVCYYIQNNYPQPNRAGDMANTLFYVFGALAIAEAGAAFLLRSRLFKRPMVRRVETMESDISNELLRRCRPLFLLVASISLYGYLYFYLTGRFQEAVFMVVFSFLVFQVIRPRHGFLHKLIAYQQQLVEQGKFRTSSLSE